VKSVAIAAPGVDILSTWLGMLTRRSRDVDGDAGVSRCAALDLAEHRSMSVDELKKKLLASTDPIVR
jgi:hypothetical protein